MIKGLFLDPRSWQIDFKSSSFWKPEQYGVKIDLHKDAFKIPNMGVDKDYKFVLCSEVWEIPLRKTLQYLRSKGLKIFLIAREPFKTDILKDAMFSYEKFLYNGEYYFKPDAVFAAGQAYANLWEGRAKTIITGYPRFDLYLDKTRWETKEKVAAKYKLNVNKKWILFPDYPPYHYKKENGKDIFVDLFKAREETLIALENFAKMNSEYQSVVKIHPSSMKPFLKKIGTGKEVSGLILERYKKPTEHMVVVGDDRQSGMIAKQLLINSDLVVGFTSTMLLEAAMINKPSIHTLFDITYNLDGIPEYCNHLPTAKNQEELHKMILNNEIGKVPDWFMEQYFYRIDGKACERICKAIIEQMK